MVKGKAQGKENILVTTIFLRLISKRRVISARKAHVWRNVSIGCMCLSNA